jgi:ESS family glutamate:Na+ symporter
METFGDSSVWSTFHLITVLLVSLLVANMLKKAIPWLRQSLIPNSVLGGCMLIVVAGIYRAFTGEVLFDTGYFGGNGTAQLELITYHCLALGFIASSFKTKKEKMTRQRTVEIFNTGITTVSTYLLQAVLGLGITIIAAKVISGFFPAAGVLLPFGYGQGTGQALNYGGIYESQFGFQGGKTFGLTIAALGFLSASIGGVFHLNLLKRRGIIKPHGEVAEKIRPEDVQGENEIPLQESMDKLTVQVALVAVAYWLAFLMMHLLSLVLPGMKSVIFGFNFILGVLAATLMKAVLQMLRKKGFVKKEYTNDFLMTRTSNFCFDIMVVAGIAAIRLSELERFWGIMLILGVVGLVSTYWYNYRIAKALFPAYAEEQFLTMYGMLTGTASTGIILLREIDGAFETPAADNMVYQNFPAIVFGFPIMLLATLAPVKPELTLGILVVFFIVMNVILFRSKLFGKKKSL